MILINKKLTNKEVNQISYKLKQNNNKMNRYNLNLIKYNLFEMKDKHYNLSQW